MEPFSYNTLCKLQGGIITAWTKSSEAEVPKTQVHY